MKQNSIVTFWHALGDFRSKSPQIWHIWTFEYVPRCEWCVLLTAKYLYFWQIFKCWLIKYWCINVMREACLYNKWCFCSNIFDNLQGINEMNPMEVFFGGGGGDDESPRWGHSPRMRSGGSGVRALSQILSDVSLSYSLKHISTGEHSLHISCRITQLLHLYFLFSWWRHQMEICSASLAFVRGIHRWLRGIHRSPVNSPHTDSDAELWYFLWSTPEQTVE